MKMQKAVTVSLLWVVAALLFNAGVYYYQGQTKAIEFFTGYLIELSLSVDNIFVFLLIFKYFRVPPDEQPRILFWGILGAQLMRAIFIFAGIGLITKFHWIIYIFGLFLAVTGLKLFFEKDKEVSPEDNPILKLCRRFFPNLSRFWTVLIVIEATDLVFAVDSVPAVLGITHDPFIVYTSNIFAILGLRAMYFVLAGIMPMFHLLHYGLGAILVFVGLKMLLEHYIQVPIAVALGFIVVALTTSIVGSYFIKPPPKK